MKREQWRRPDQLAPQRCLNPGRLRGPSPGRIHVREYGSTPFAAGLRRARRRIHGGDRLPTWITAKGPAGRRRWCRGQCALSMPRQLGPGDDMTNITAAASAHGPKPAGSRSRMKNPGRGRGRRYKTGFSMFRSLWLEAGLSERREVSAAFIRGRQRHRPEGECPEQPTSGQLYEGRMHAKAVQSRVQRDASEAHAR